MMLAGAHERGHLLSFLQRSSNSQELASTDASLLSALDVAGASTAGSMPLEFAQQFLARSAHASAKLAAGFLQSGVAPTSGSYAPQSGQIFGILKTLQEDFEKTL